MYFRSLLAMLFLVPATGYAAEGPDPLGPMLKQVETCRPTESRKPLTDATRIIEQMMTNPGSRRQACQDLVALLQSGSATAGARAFACDQLGVIGDASAVPAIAALLGDAQLAPAARNALERIGGDAAAGALRSALAKSEATAQIGVINSLGVLRDAGSVTMLGDLAATTEDEPVRLACIDALGSIASPAAADRLLSLRTRTFAHQPPERLETLDHAIVETARRLAPTDPAGSVKLLSSLAGAEPAPSSLYRAAAVRALLALQPSPEAILKAVADRDLLVAAAGADTIATAHDDATARYASAIATVPAANRPLLLSALGRRGDPAAAAAILAATTDKDAAIRAAAYDALASVADETTVNTLAGRLAASGADRAAVASTLRQVHFQNADLILLAALRKAPPGEQALLIPVLVARHATAAKPLLVNLVASPDRAVRLAAIAAIRALDPHPTSLPGLLDALQRMPDDGSRAALQPLLAVLLPESPDPDILIKALERAPDAAQPALLRLLACTPSEEALRILQMSTGVKQPEVRDAAIRALAEWPDASAEAPLQRVASDPDSTTVQHVLAIRALVRLATNPSLHQKPEAISLLKKLQPLARRDEEKQLVADALQRCAFATNLARGAVATSPDDLESDGAASGDAAAVDGDIKTYWDEVDNQPLYRLLLTWPSPVPVHALRITGYQQHNYAPKTFTILADGKPIQTIRNAVYTDNVLLIRLPQPVRATTLELNITGYHGRSPAIRELEVFDDGPLPPAPSAK